MVKEREQMIRERKSYKRWKELYDSIREFIPYETLSKVPWAVFKMEADRLKCYWTGQQQDWEKESLELLLKDEEPKLEGLGALFG